MITYKPPMPYPLVICVSLFLVSSLLQPFCTTTTAQTYKNVSKGDFLIAGQRDSSSFWASPSGEFAFGFQAIRNAGFLLAIWFNKIPARTIVWWANGTELLAPAGSKVQLTADGQLVLLKGTTGEKIWQAEPSDNRVFVSHAAMLDTGSFVLATAGSEYLWETFTSPTDTLLPSQTMVQRTTLVARHGETNYSDGRFTFTLQGDGNLVAYAKHTALDSVMDYYWASSTNNATKLIFNTSGSIYLEVMDGSIINVLPSNAVSMQDFYHRGILEYDGAFRHYVYPKSTSSAAGRPMAWTCLSAVPPNICRLYPPDRGLGPCGFNSYCSYQDQKSSCHCPEGFSFIDPNDRSRGCQQNFVSQSCTEPSSDTDKETDRFYFYDIPNGDWHLNDYEWIHNVTEDFCRRNCLADCFCGAATYTNGDCHKKMLPLSNGRTESGVYGITMVKTRKARNSTLQPPGGYPKSENKDLSTLIIIGAVLLGSSVFLNIFSLQVMAVRFVKRKRRNIQPLVLPGMDLQCFTYEEIKIVTDEFKEEIGSGSFGRVFKGFLASGVGNYVAVKTFNSMVAEREQEFNAEVSAIGRTNHRNLIKLIGFCNEKQHRLLVYEFMSNGSLSNFLFGDSRINWYDRIQIALEIARGLLYLHEGCSTPIIHCDIKPQNILLDDSFTAKISDFGLAKLLKIEQSRTMTGIRGTKGYVAPEWFRSKPITIKVDVYSYGILFLEIICSRKCFDTEAEDEHKMVLADWAYDCYVERKLDQLMKDDKEAMEYLERVEKYVKIAIWCIQENPAQRPPMDRVIQMIEGSIEVPIPPDPSSS
ncbi:G-type lectin S-receptor-like serine/threonine-protein kinase LECRK3 [Ziziphus jujuba]|uniref:Receptor-like serine/threonine-protein kinase n=1 Tax=Ziziphus jujuba TaxID=326968 RepID=A0A6P3ZL68_ZIZJJ|nr:G-type lectin S-receptor-like serine/threonine-protein kinase LECRK3 [Ziziphus jujuba]